MVYTEEYLKEFMIEFIDKHWPKNDTAAHGGPATPRTRHSNSYTGYVPG